MLRERLDARRLRRLDARGRVRGVVLVGLGVGRGPSRWGRRGCCERVGAAHAGERDDAGGGVVAAVARGRRAAPAAPRRRGRDQRGERGVPLGELPAPGGARAGVVVVGRGVDAVHDQEARVVRLEEVRRACCTSVVPSTCTRSGAYGDVAGRARVAGRVRLVDGLVVSMASPPLGSQSMVGSQPPPALTMIQNGPLYLPCRRATAARGSRSGAITARPAIPATCRNRRRSMVSSFAYLRWCWGRLLVEELVIGQEVRHDRHPRAEREVLVVVDLRPRRAGRRRSCGFQRPGQLQARSVSPAWLSSCHVSRKSW